MCSYVSLLSVVSLHLVCDLSNRSGASKQLKVVEIWYSLAHSNQSKQIYIAPYVESKSEAHRHVGLSQLGV